MAAYHAAVGAEEAVHAASEGAVVEASSEGGWSPDWLVEPIVSEYEIQRLRAIVANERGLLNLNLIPHTQVSRSIHNLEQALILQSAQQSSLHEKIGRAVAARAIMHGIQMH